MVWVKVDDHFDENPKWVGAPGDSIALWLAALAWCNRNDSIEGFIPELKLQGRVHVRNLKRSIADLVDREAFHPVDGGYVIHDYVEYQQPEKVREIREKRAAAGRKGARNRWAERDRQREHGEAPPPTDDMANAIASDEASAIANGCPVPRSPSLSSVEEQHPPYAYPPFAIEDDQRSTNGTVSIAASIGAWQEGLRGA
jgi:hypothetical protein